MSCPASMGINPTSSRRVGGRREELGREVGRIQTQKGGGTVKNRRVAWGGRAQTRG